MGAFEGNPKTETRENKSKEDNKSPDWGSLNHRTITAAQAMAGVNPGTDTKIVRGDYSEAVLQRRNTTILGKDTQNLQNDHEETIEGVATITIKGGRHLMVDQIDDTAVRGERTMWVLGADSEHYSTHREISEPFEFEMKGVEMGAKGLSVDIKGMSAETTALTVAIDGIKIVAGVFSETNELIEDELKQICGLTEGLDVKVGLLSLHLNPRLNGAPTLSASAPFGA